MIELPCILKPQGNARLLSFRNIQHTRGFHLSEEKSHKTLESALTASNQQMNPRANNVKLPSAIISVAGLL